MFRTVVSFGIYVILLILVYMPGNDFRADTPLPTEHLCPNYEVTRNYKLRTGDEIAQSLEESAEAVGITFGFSAYLAPRGIYPVGPETFVIEPNSSITIDFGVYYIGGLEDELDIRFLALLDEQQLDIASNSDTTHYYDVFLQPNMASLFSFELAPLALGIYDLVVVGIPNVDTIPMFGDLTNIMSLTRRITLIVGDETTVSAKQRTYVPTPTAVSKAEFGGDYLFGFHLDDSRLWWSYPETSLNVQPGQVLNFNIKTGYLGSPPRTNKEQVALVLFEDYRQIMIDETASALYIEIEEGAAYAQIPISLTTPSTTGRHDITALRITNPGVPRCIQLGTPEGAAHWYQVIGDRVSINVLG